MHKDILNNKAHVLETIVLAEQFLQENGDRLLREQRDDLQRKIDELRKYFDGLEDTSTDIYNDTKALIDQLERDLSDEVWLSLFHVG